MRFRILIISRIHIVRKKLTESLQPLGYIVHTYADIREPITKLNLIKPDAVIIDGDGAEKEWRLIAHTMQNFTKNHAYILIKSTISKADAKEAAKYGISGIIVKPFDSEEHISRIIQIIDTKLHIPQKRHQPRYYPDDAITAELQYFINEGKELNILDIENIHEEGALVSIRFPKLSEDLRPGRRIVAAKLLLGSQDISISFKVVFRRMNKIGLHFEDIRSNRKAFETFLQEYTNKVFGPYEYRKGPQQEQLW
ncbi:MAG: response regulator [Spirochaetia bacterium]